MAQGRIIFLPPTKPWPPGAAKLAAMEQQPQQPQQQGATGFSSVPVFAAVVETKRRSTAERSESVSKVARLRDFQLRLSPFRFTISLQSSPLDSRIEGVHVQGSSPLVASASTSSALPLLPPLPSYMSSILRFHFLLVSRRKA